MEFDLTFFALAIPAVMFAGISKAGFGSGAAFAAASILALVVEPALALGIMLPLLMLIDVSSLKPYWGKWSGRDAKRLILGSIPGVGLAIWLYQIADADVFRLLIGGISLAFVAYEIARKRGLLPKREAPFSSPVGLFAGVTAGFTSFVSHAGGPPVAVYLLSQGLQKTTYQATTVLVFWAINGFKALPYAILGVFTWQTLLIDLLLAPFAILGAWLGVRAHFWIPEKAFFTVTYILLTITGTKLIWDALS
ncbi:sulfite exporter TauE/SafE family protein [Nereida sp. MMG025]|uniref:sulfite exporter TauE/SafE family protein n=1 Tax=Nereida sp. MMG025 TaxID=2909981 RepID=UPI001F17BE99|nr:sulfite exporter TauE/SafE family protein [Nereida sp. MMG025]MCF6445496.1 sulfite exporter TauE/SafE family protein [Nereida sp. MMG025]